MTKGVNHLIASRDPSGDPVATIFMYDAPESTIAHPDLLKSVSALPLHVIYHSKLTLVGILRGRRVHELLVFDLEDARGHRIAVCRYSLDEETTKYLALCEALLPESTKDFVRKRCSLPWEIYIPSSHDDMDDFDAVARELIAGNAVMIHSPNVATIKSRHQYGDKSFDGVDVSGDSYFKKDKYHGVDGNVITFNNNINHEMKPQRLRALGFSSSSDEWERMLRLDVRKKIRGTEHTADTIRRSTVIVLLLLAVLGIVVFCERSNA